MATINQKQDFVILGPALQRDNKVLEAIHALYFLPDNFKLIFAADTPADQTFYKEAQSLVARNELYGRVQFMAQALSSNAVIASDKQAAADNIITGDSPEALASAILNLARAYA